MAQGGPNILSHYERVSDYFVEIFIFTFLNLKERFNSKLELAEKNVEIESLKCELAQAKLNKKDQDLKEFFTELTQLKGK